MAVYERNGWWWVDTYAKGRRVRRRISPDKETADLVEKDLKVKAAREEYLGIVEQRKVRFTDYAREYLEWSQANKAPATYLMDSRVVAQQLVPFLQGKPLGTISRKDVEDFKTRRARTLQPRSVNRELAVLRGMLSKAVEWEYLTANPAQGVKDLKAQKRPPSYLTLEQLDVLLQACEPPHLRAFVALAGFAGLRLGEILQLRWDDVDFGRREVQVRQRTKSYRARTVPMAQRLVDELGRFGRHLPGPHVLCHADGKPYRSIRHAFAATLAHTDLPRIRVHDLRHSFASNLAAAGAPLNVVQELLGHQDIKATMVYAHLAPNAKAAAVAVLDAGPRQAMAAVG